MICRYSWEDTAVRTERVYRQVLATPALTLRQQLSRCVSGVDGGNGSLSRSDPQRLQRCLLRWANHSEYGGPHRLHTIGPVSGNLFVVIRLFIQVLMALLEFWSPAAEIEQAVDWRGSS